MNIISLPPSVTLVAVTKTFPVKTIIEAHHSGIRHFGENYVEEFEEKYQRLPQEIKDNAIFHMIGHVQSRKVKKVVELFDWVDSVDSVKLAARLSRFAAEAGKTMHILLEVNLIGEASKYGFDPDTLRSSIETIAALPHLIFDGLMIMPPLVTNPEDNRGVFRSAKRLFEEIGIGHHLSMGTSQDYQVAIEEGATMVRLGTAIFGSRS